MATTNNTLSVRQYQAQFKALLGAVLQNRHTLETSSEETLKRWMVFPTMQWLFQ